MQTLESLLKKGTTILKDNGLEEAGLDAWLLLEYVTYTMFCISENRLLCTNSACSATSSVRAFRTATFSASSDRSTPVPCASALSFRILIRIQPDPVHISRIYGFFTAFMHSRADSTSVSVSCLGTSSFLST